MYDKKYTVAQLKKICKDKKIKGYSKLKKGQLVKKCLDGKSPSPAKPEAPKEKKMTVAQLKKECKKNGVKGYSKMKKAQLVKNCLKHKTLSPAVQRPKQMVLVKKVPSMSKKTPSPAKKSPSVEKTKEMGLVSDAFLALLGVNHRLFVQPRMPIERLDTYEPSKEIINKLSTNDKKNVQKLIDIFIAGKFKIKDNFGSSRDYGINNRMKELYPNFDFSSKKTKIKNIKKLAYLFSLLAEIKELDMVGEQDEIRFVRGDAKKEIAKLQKLPQELLNEVSELLPYAKKMSILLKTPSPLRNPLSQFSSPEDNPKKTPTPKNNSLKVEEYEFRNGNSNKFWKIKYDDKNGGDFEVEYGRIGCQKCTKQNKNATLKKIKSLIQSKIKKGYKLKGSVQSPAKSPAKKVNKEQVELDKFNQEFNNLKSQNQKLEAKGDYDAMDKLFSRAVKKLQPYILKAKNNVPLAKRIAEIYTKEEQTYSEFIGYGKGYEYPEHDEVYDKYIAKHEQW